MKSRSTFSVLFWINTSRTSLEQSKLYARITLNGKRVNLSLKHEIPANDWDKKRSKVKGRTPEAQEINEYIQHVRAELYSSYRELMKADAEVTAEAVKAHFLGEEEDQKSLQDLFDYHNLHHNHNLSAATMSHYRTTQNYLLEYIYKINGKEDIHLNKLDFNFVTGFETFLRTYHPKHYHGTMSNNGAMKHLQRFRKMIRIALNLGWISNNPLKGYKIKMEKKEREFLTAPELASIENYATSVERLEIVKDLFVFSCYTGLSYCDLIVLNNSHLATIDDKKWILTKRAKTDTAVRLPLLKAPVDILEKYRDHPRRGEDNLLPRLSNQKLNSYLKELADKCKINKHLTFHMARHTFATTVTLTNGVPIETVSKILGHTRLATTQIYARVLDQKISQDMELLQRKLDIEH
ncbi:integrase [Christiangramia fulva]|uniref:Integrase n=1 Tax=Christiangramia fulva TaxID=2126553 RepID=A0A2R3Z1Z0_9FLAO|nr:site-specific integrase [Christiangramia fulva]AVR44258.1 integrase [Christiangramia fulva]